MLPMKECAKETPSQACGTIATILPDWVSVAESFGVHHGVLLPEEEALVHSAMPTRCAELAAGRTCARRALAGLGISSQPILCGPEREPIWPLGIVGSITHCDGYCAAGVALSNNDRWFGIDAEPNSPMPEGLIDIVASEREIEMAADASICITNWDRLLFSAKESVYKTWYPIRKAWLDFKDIAIALMPATSSFALTFLSPAMNWFEHRRSTFSGRYLLTESHIFTSAVVSASLDKDERYTRN